MDIDFGWMDDISGQKAQNEGLGRGGSGEHSDGKNADMDATEASSRERNLLQAEQQMYSDSMEMFREYQENRKAADEGIRELLRGVQAGENIGDLFLTGCLCISQMTGNDTFYSQMEKSYLEIYGMSGKREAHALKVERKRMLDTMKAINVSDDKGKALFVSLDKRVRELDQYLPEGK